MLLSHTNDQSVPPQMYTFTRFYCRLIFADDSTNRVSHLTYSRTPRVHIRFLMSQIAPRKARGMQPGLVREEPYYPFRAALVCHLSGRDSG